MRTFVEKPKATQRITSPKAEVRTPSHFGRNHDVSPILHLQRTIGNQTIEANTTDVEGGSNENEITQFHHNFTRMPVYSERQQSPSEEKESQISSISAPQNLRQLRRAYFSGEVEHATSIVQKNLGKGNPLLTSVKAQMNQHFGRDFSFVRIHTDEFSSEASKALDANAFTIANDIVFGSGMYHPDTPTGQMRLAHELAHVIQQTGNSTGQHDELEQQASYAAVLGTPYLQHMRRVAPMIQREPTYPRRATSNQMIAEARRVLSLTRNPTSSNETVRMWSNVSSNFGTVTAGSIARRIWTHIFLRHFTEPESRGGVESSHPRYLYSHQYGWIDAQHFFGFIDIAEKQSLRNPSDRQAAFNAATAEGLSIEENQQKIRDYVILQQEPARDARRLMQVRPPNTPLFRAPVAVAGATMAAAARTFARFMLRGTQHELYSQLNERQRNKFFLDSAKSAFTFEDFVSNQLGTRFFFQHGNAINSALVANRERLFLAALSTFFSSIRVENNQQILNQLARNLPTIERFEAPKTTEDRERQRHPDLFRLP